ncbi:putative LOB domain-containing protein 40 [Iris pallida]|uniref:LOB domain-containing protein 40 n=1 Tax=Iris pallida TaxID=29817 RepID=A0AAX6HBS1_IRIPA|nr:putative LOB domain-containing protein 40 [Iris pallida]
MSGRISTMPLPPQLPPLPPCRCGAPQREQDCADKVQAIRPRPGKAELPGCDGIGERNGGVLEGEEPRIVRERKPVLGRDRRGVAREPGRAGDAGSGGERRGTGADAVVRAVAPGGAGRGGAVNRVVDLSPT